MLHELKHLNQRARRKWLKAAAAASLLTMTGRLSAAVPVWRDARFASNPFTLGVASGDPLPDGFVIWSKLALKPLERGQGMPKRAIEVDWLVATDERMRDVVRKGKAIAHPELGHAVHVELAGLQPARDYFYQFSAGGEQSAIGRARTLPPAGAALARLRFGVAGCQRYEDGYFTAYRHMAGENLDFIFHYGDYIYEYGPMRATKTRPVIREMPGLPDEIYSLDDYRNRYAIYKLDPDLQAAHQATPFVMSFDDHEVDNDWAGDTTEEDVPAEIFLLRRASAFQAWYEHMPVRHAQMPRGPQIQMYRRFAAGNLLNVHVLDTRQYRSPFACGRGVRVDCVEAADPARSLLGAGQERWLHDAFNANTTRWNVLAQQIPIMRQDRNPDPAILGPSMDKWDGYTATRERLFAAAEAAKLQNLVSVCGDVHFNCAGDLKKNFADEKSPALGVEFVATSVTSLGDGFDIDARFKALMQQDPHIRFYNGQRGDVTHTVTPEQWRADYKVLDRVSTKDGKLSTRRSFLVESGRAGLRDA
jgi:alkaline phosphatase D